MAQTLQVLKCYSCNMFQVQIKKKSKRWACKICGEKQSVTKIYGEGSGKDCRMHVQKLNAMKGNLEEEERWVAVRSLEEDDANDTWDDFYEEEVQAGASAPVVAKKSKWSHFLEDESQDESQDLKENEVKITKKIYESQPQGQDLENSNYSAYEACEELLRIDSNHSNRVPPVHMHAEHKHSTFQRKEPKLMKRSPSKEVMKKGEILPALLTENNGKVPNSIERKCRQIFCATKTEELDELLEL